MLDYALNFSLCHTKPIASDMYTKHILVTSSCFWRHVSTKEVIFTLVRNYSSRLLKDPSLVKEILTQAVFQWRTSGAGCMRSNWTCVTFSSLYIVLICVHRTFNAWFNAMKSRVVTSVTDSWEVGRKKNDQLRATDPKCWESADSCKIL